MTVPSGPQGSCRETLPSLVHSSEGYIANTVSDQTGCGLADAPWVIEVHPGQRVNVTLMDFTQRIHKDGSVGNSPGVIPPGLAQPSDGVCRVYATIREVADSRSTTVCATHVRVRNVYISSTHRVEVRILNSQTAASPSFFLLKYEGKNQQELSSCVCECERSAFNT